MDSLMDAMTNVVGILLLILIVSSLGITAAVKKIVENMPEISVEELEAMKSSRQKTLDNLAELRSTKAEVEEQIDPEEVEQLALALEQFEKENEELARMTSDLEELLAKSKELEPIKEEKEERNTEAVEQLNDLEAALAAKPKRNEPPPREITLPDPRPADDQSLVFYVACRHEKLYVIGDPYELMVKIRDALDANFTRLVYRGGEIGSYVHNINSTRENDRGGFEPLRADFQARTRRDKEALDYLKPVNLKSLKLPEGRSIFERVFGTNENQQESKREFPVRKFRLDQAKVQEFFEANASKGPLVYHPEFAGDRIRIEVSVNPEQGLTEEQLFSGDSPFVELIKRANVLRRVALIYYVAPDSFDIYLKARDYSTLQRVNAGWVLWNSERLDNLRPNRTRDRITYNLNALPDEEYLQLSKFLGPIVAEKVNARIDSFEKDLETVPIPENIKGQNQIDEFKAGVREHREKWAEEAMYDVMNIYTTPLAAAQVDRLEEIAIDVQPPEVMHARIFRPNGVPNAPIPPARDRPEPTGPKPIILD